MFWRIPVSTGLAGVVLSLVDDSEFAQVRGYFDDSQIVLWTPRVSPSPYCSASRSSGCSDSNLPDWSAVRISRPLSVVPR
jgi:hypothetical protein